MADTVEQNPVRERVKSGGLYQVLDKGRSAAVSRGSGATPRAPQNQTSAPVTETVLEAKPDATPTATVEPGGSTVLAEQTPAPTGVTSEPEVRTREAEGQTQSQPSTETASVSEVSTTDRAAEPAKPVQQTPGKKIIRLQRPDDLVQLPGEKPKTLEQLTYELKEKRGADKQRDQLAERVRVLEEENAKLVRVREQPKQEEAKAPTFDKPRPQRPKDAMEGDPEWNSYQDALEDWRDERQAWLVAQAAQAAVAQSVQPITERTQKEELASRTFAQNDEIFTQGLATYLPFDYNGLDEEAQKVVLQKVMSVAQAKGVPIHDRNAMSSKVYLTEDKMDAIIAHAWPEGSVPPGYTLADDDDAVDETVEEVKPPVPGIDTPLVAKAPPPPPLPMGATASSAPRFSDRPKSRSQSFREKLGQAT